MTLISRGPCLSLVIWMACLAGCATESHRKGYPPLLEEAQLLRGENLAVVKKRLGNPADEQSGGRVFWFLTADSKYHPEPKAQLFELIFKGDQLVEIRKASP